MSYIISGWCSHWRNIMPHWRDIMLKEHHGTIFCVYYYISKYVCINVKYALHVSRPGPQTAIFLDSTALTKGHFYTKFLIYLTPFSGSLTLGFDPGNSTRMGPMMIPKMFPKLMIQHISRSTRVQAPVMIPTPMMGCRRIQGQLEQGDGGKRIGPGHILKRLCFNILIL